MCGIAGIYNYADATRPVDRDLLVRMTRALAHRGPDGEGFHIDGPIGLGHRRLAIVELSSAGHQPMSTGDGSCWLTYNGEFYNHLDFRIDLERDGHRFRGGCDTETLLALLRARGTACLSDIAGIFGFGFWDQRAKRLTLARDPLGVKQVYYFDDGKRLLFASEIKALLMDPDVPREPDAQAINDYLHFHTPLFERTFFNGIRQVAAGEYLQVSRNGLRRPVKYWSVDNFERRGGDRAENVTALKHQLAHVVSQQLMSDVPVGVFFSGGIDSTAIAAFAAQSGKTVRCFGAHFSGQGVIDERPFQEATARALGLQLELVSLDGSSFPEDLLRLSYVQDAPVIGPAMFPMYKVSQLAASRVKVCLGGQAADEIFGGYARYALVRPWKVLSSWLKGRRSGDCAEGTASGNVVAGNLGRQVDRRALRRLAAIAMTPNWRTRYFDNFAMVPEHEWRGVIDAPDVVSRRSSYELFLDTLNRSSARDATDKVMHWDMQTYLTGLFQQDDRMSMAWSLESRVPMADPRLVRFAFQSGPDLKFRAGATKWLLRQAISDVVPDEILNRRKVGFDTPAARWMKDEHSDFLHDLLLSTRARQRGLWNARSVATLLDQKDHPLWFDIVWKITAIESWARVFLDRNEASIDRRETDPHVRASL